MTEERKLPACPSQPEAADLLPAGCSHLSSGSATGKGIENGHEERGSEVDDPMISTESRCKAPESRMSVPAEENARSTQMKCQVQSLSRHHLHHHPLWAPGCHQIQAFLEGMVLFTVFTSEALPSFLVTDSGLS